MDKKKFLKECARIIKNRDFTDHTNRQSENQAVGFDFKKMKKEAPKIVGAYAGSIKL